jgi:hypothetical protein
MYVALNLMGSELTTFYRAGTALRNLPTYPQGSLEAAYM